MAKIKYTYDTQSCRYQRVRKSWSDIVINALGLLASAVVVALVILLVNNFYFDTETTRSLRKENQTLEKHYTTLKADLVDLEEVISVLRERDENIYRKIYEAEPLKDEGLGGLAEEISYRDVINSGWNNKKYIDEVSRKVEGLLKRSDDHSMKEIIRLIHENDAKLQALPAIQPIANNNLNQLASGYGMRINPFHKARVMHFGVDFAAPRGENVVATGNGKVITVKKSNTLQTGYGNYVEIDHGYGYITKYAHLEDIKVKEGQKVERGQMIATVGSSGGSIAPHVHYEIIRDKKKIDPLHFFINGISDHDFRELRKLAVQENQALD